MITDTLAQCRRYACLSPQFAAAFDFLGQLSPALPDGRHEIQDDHCFALVQSYTTKPLAQARFEAHRRHIDIQFIQAGREAMLWAPLAALTQVTQAYSDEKDVAFFANPLHWTPVNVHAGQFTIFFPEDGHAPGIECAGPAEVQKIVIKLRI
jgi:biofilm protein TabA